MNFHQLFNLKEKRRLFTYFLNKPVLVFVKEEIANSQNQITADEMNGIAILELSNLIFRFKNQVLILLQNQKQGSVQIHTGGITADSVKIIAEYFIAKKWWGQLQFEAPGNPRMLSIR
ncbi:hypothetical protein LIT32_19260 [Bacillus sp. CMF21]|uniref:hypothetical protein n=1 Tax=Metabacillus dongyingensis TaxID=2874282 RepID=UPI001CBAD1DE|nr:hypothetical protein [Metabacillus dongyingensis]UAL51302.1 hypothetical protein K8L98_19110 [Metabacillus dongyingensis]UOK57245.1 hypothetical protein MGI18_21955 [Bacillus sp. OVS6]USK27600.1 hypothetical protein LIT32_19260 [Bacillus sp. CMF21]